jgi:CheY-like chemotaxis protein
MRYDVGMPRALVIDDDPVAAESVATWLRGRGWEVDTGASAEEALLSLALGPPDLLVSDVVMPGMDGPSLCASVRLQPFDSRLPVVLLSARESARDEAEAAGADLFLQKPVDLDQLGAFLDRAFSGPSVGEAPPLPEPAAAIPHAPGQVVASGTLGPGWLVPVLRDAHHRKLDGVLEVEATAGKGRIEIERGALVAAQVSDPTTGLGQVLADMELLDASAVERCVDECRRTRRPLADLLLSSGLLAQADAERALREQLLRRAIFLGGLWDGAWRLREGTEGAAAGFPVHAIAAAWRLGSAAFEARTPTNEHVRATLSAADWEQLDLPAELAAARVLLDAGAMVPDVVSVGGEPASRLLAALGAFGCAQFSDDPPGVGPATDGEAARDAEAYAAHIEAELAVRGDADPYTTLGLGPGAAPAEIAAAVARGLEIARPPAAAHPLPPAAQERGRALSARILEAGRRLLHPETRALYDRRLGAHRPHLLGSIGGEDHAVLQAERAREFFRRGDHVLAAGLLHAALLLEGESPDILAMLGWARHRACPEDPDCGEAELARAIELAPSDEFAHYYLGRIYADRGEPARAREFLRAALARNHEFGAARDALRSLGE